MAAPIAFVRIDREPAPGGPTPTRVRLDQVAAIEPAKTDAERVRVTLLSGAVLIGSRSASDVWDAMLEAARWLEAAVDDE